MKNHMHVPLHTKTGSVSHLMCQIIIFCMNFYATQIYQFWVPSS